MCIKCAHDAILPQHCNVTLMFKKNYAANDLITHCTMNCIINMFNIYILKQINLWDLALSLVNWGIFLCCREVYYVIALWMQAQSTWVDMPLIYRWFATAFNMNIFALFLEQYFFLHSFQMKSLKMYIFFHCLNACMFLAMWCFFVCFFFVPCTEKIENCSLPRNMIQSVIHKMIL